MVVTRSREFMFFASILLQHANDVGLVRCTLVASKPFTPTQAKESTSHSTFRETGFGEPYLSSVSVQVGEKRNLGAQDSQQETKFMVIGGLQNRDIALSRGIERQAWIF